MENSIPKIIGVAIKLKDGRIFSLPKPNRHNHVFLHMKECGIPREGSIRSTQGFVDDSGRFLTRKEAAALARYNGQFDSNDDMIFSEDLW